LLRTNDLRRTIAVGGNAARGGLDKLSFFCNCDHGSRQAGQNAFSPEKNARLLEKNAGDPILTFVSIQETSEARTHLWL
jgi:hypothetical protein